MAELLLRLRDREMKRVPILSARFTIGRDTTCDLMIDNAGVSRTHALVLFADEVYRVQDAESQNGITLNGKPVKDAVLKYGDTIGIGKFDIVMMQSAHAPQRVEMPKQAGARNVMKTLQMDTNAAAKMQQEIMAKLAEQKAGGARPPAGAAAARPAPAAGVNRPGAGTSKPAPAPARRSPSPPPPPMAIKSDVAETAKIVAIILAGAFAIGAIIYFAFLKH